MKTMRPIKFRAWDIENKAWIDLNVLTEWHNYPYMGLATIEGKNVLRLDDATDGWAWSQFTGLHDKNGKEIYEGDILVFARTEHHPGNGNFKVYWDAERAMFHVERFPKEKFMTPDLRQENCTHYEVIGNIYETPNLLQ